MKLGAHFYERFIVLLTDLQDNYLKKLFWLMTTVIEVRKTYIFFLLISSTILIIIVFTIVSNS